ncbi:MAG: spore coat U domain-containing protein [Nostoc sp.]|uniref:Csu type fimbrial protein n=1 Tax=Nostoc sp. TaxID=1180 RepID=UPI002FF76760
MKNQKSILIFGIILNCTTALPALSQCNVSVDSVKFGSYDVFNNSSTTTTGTINYDCSSAIPSPSSITIDLSKGNAPSYTPRQLKNGTNVLNYNLYLDASGQSIWGNNIDSQHYISPNPKNTVTIYGIIPARQNVRIGTYIDSITATVNF